MARQRRRRGVLTAGGRTLPVLVDHQNGLVIDDVRAPSKISNVRDSASAINGANNGLAGSSLCK
uniref:Uncharacterized protein n=1 Tax=Romanomermis culicivorax TaxID=13658 RepID=A0A915JLI1_ROMCU